MNKKKAVKMVYFVKWVVNKKKAVKMVLDNPYLLLRFTEYCQDATVGPNSFHETTIHLNLFITLLMGSKPFLC